MDIIKDDLIKNRKNDHIRLCLNEDVNSCLSNGFQNYHLVYNALPEIDYNDIDLTTTFLGKKINYPFLLSSMTGGTPYAKQINQRLAQAAQALNVPMGVGSQRAMLKDLTVQDTFRIRDWAPDIPLLANFGAVQLNYGYSVEHCQFLVDTIGADALILHLNPLHEAVQPEGDTNFKNLAEKIKEVVAGLSVPVIVKEVGCGISGEVAFRLQQCGVQIIDVAGAGGTSFPVVEGYRAGLKDVKLFGQLGVPTADCIVSVKKTTNDLFVIASGGMRNGIEIAKALALGAGLVGFARPALHAAQDSQEAVQEVIGLLAKELQVTMFSAGVSTISQLKEVIIDRKD